MCFWLHLDNDLQVIFPQLGVSWVGCPEPGTRLELCISPHFKVKRRRGKGVVFGATYPRVKSSLSF